MDLFIIIAAVLAVGGVVTAAVYSLAGSASTNASVQVVQASITGSPTATTLGAFSLTIKNTGSSTISCTTSSCQIQFSGTNTGATPTPTMTGLVASQGGTWTATATAAIPEILSPGSSFTLSPGQQVSLSFTSLLMGSAATGAPTSSSTVTINVVGWGNAQASIKLTAQ